MHPQLYLSSSAGEGGLRYLSSRKKTKVRQQQCNPLGRKRTYVHTVLGPYGVLPFPLKLLSLTAPDGGESVHPFQPSFRRKERTVSVNYLYNCTGTVRFELTTFGKSSYFQDKCHKPDSTKYPLHYL